MDKFIIRSLLLLLFCNVNILTEEVHVEEVNKPVDIFEAQRFLKKAKRPNDLAQPQHWRYVPEERLLSGNIFQRFLISSFLAPVFFFQEDIGAGAGIALTDIDFRNRRRQEFFGMFLTYTTEGQQRFSGVWQRWLQHRELPNGGVLMNERDRVRINAGYEKTLTRRFFGYGPDSRPEDETSYTDEGVHAKGALSLGLPTLPLLFTAELWAITHKISRGFVSTIPSSEELFPEIIAAADDNQAVWAGVELAWDSRDSLHSPYMGLEMRVRGEWTLYHEQLDPGAKYTAEITGVIPLPGLFHDGGSADEEDPPTDTFVVSTFVQDTTGELGFYDAPTLGGNDTLRGYIEQRFTGAAAWHASAEYRFWFLPRGIRFTKRFGLQRVGAALFYDYGAVRLKLSDRFFRDGEYSYGLGLRMALERQAHFRLDVGRSTEDTNVVFTFGYAF